MSEAEQDTDKNRAQTTTTEQSTYPDHHVYYTHGGQRFEIGNQKGRECIKVFHPSGSYCEWFPDGKFYQMNIGENKQYNKGGVTITVDENNDVHIKGHSKLQIGGGCHIEVSGDAGIVVGGNAAMAMLGKGTALSAKGNLYLGVDGDLNMNVKGATNITSGGPINIESTGGDAQYKAAGETTVTSVKGDTNIQSFGSDVITRGIFTKIQGGGAGAPPTTFS